MNDYLPKFKPGEAVTFRAAEDLEGGQLLAVTATGAVKATTGVSTAWVGVASHDTLTGRPVTVFSGGVQRPTASGPIAAGEMVAAAANGAVATIAAPEPGQQVGVALNAAADGDPVPVAFAR